MNESVAGTIKRLLMEADSVSAEIVADAEEFWTGSGGRGDMLMGWGLPREWGHFEWSRLSKTQKNQIASAYEHDRAHTRVDPEKESEARAWWSSADPNTREYALKDLGQPIRWAKNDWNKLSKGQRADIALSFAVYSVPTSKAAQ